jgi:uncharacterized protein YdaU (DUF1376 family)
MGRAPRARTVNWDWAAFLNDDRVLAMSAEELGLWIRALGALAQAERPGHLPAGLNTLRRVTSASSREWNRSGSAIIKALETDENGEWVHRRTERDHLEQTVRMEEAKSHGAGAAKARWDRARAMLEHDTRAIPPSPSPSPTPENLEARSKAGADAPPVILTSSPNPTDQNLDTSSTDQNLTTAASEYSRTLVLPPEFSGPKFTNTLQVREMKIAEVDYPPTGFGPPPDPGARNGDSPTPGDQRVGTAVRATGASGASSGSSPIRSLLPELAEVCRHAGAEATRTAIGLVTRLAKNGLTHPRILVRIAKHYVEHRADMRNPWAYYNPGGRGFEAIKLTLNADQSFEEHEAIKQAELAWKGHPR